MWAFIGVLSFLGWIVFGIIALISVFRKNGKAKKQFLYSGISFVICIGAMAADPSTDDDPKKEELTALSPASEEVEDTGEPTEDQPAAETVSADVEEEPAAEDPIVEEAPVVEDNSISFDGNGTFAVNDEVQPGIYRAEGITYWARLAGFSGELDDVLANGTPSGPAIVEIKATDAGFQSMGFGEWTLIDDTYAPEVLKEFGDGTYIVGKDIEPGTYKSNDSVVYWARLKNFSGDLDSIISNGTPTGPEIVEISSSDIGFQTTGGGTWTKIE